MSRWKVPLVPVGRRGWLATQMHIGPELPTTLVLVETHQRFACVLPQYRHYFWSPRVTATAYADQFLAEAATS